MPYLGVDGGGTKTAFMLINKKGEIIATAKKESCHYKSEGLNKFKDVIDKGVYKVCEEAGINLADLSYSFLGIPCYGEYQADTPILENIIKNILANKDFECDNDAKAGWAGSLACQPGINIVAGTGAIGFGVDDSGNSARASGWGYFVGDEGSGYWLGKQLLSLFTKQSDGRMAKTYLYDLIRSEFELEEDFELLTLVYDELELKRSNISRLALLASRAAQKGDEEARKLFREAACEHSLTIKAIIEKLNFQDSDDITVSYSGGVFNAGDLLLNPLQEYIEKYIKEYQVKLIKPILQPVTGAALYALYLDYQKKQGIDTAELQNLIENLQQEEERYIVKQ